MIKKLEKISYKIVEKLENYPVFILKRRNKINKLLKRTLMIIKLSDYTFNMSCVIEETVFKVQILSVEF